MKKPSGTIKRRKAAKTSASAGRRPPASRRRAPRQEELRVRVTVAIAPDELAWLEAQAAQKRLSVSATFSEVLRFGMRDAAWERCFSAVGGAPELTQKDTVQIDAEFRELGLIA